MKAVAIHGQELKCKTRTLSYHPTIPIRNHRALRLAPMVCQRSIQKFLNRNPPCDILNDRWRFA
jgi:hypothetical protein